MAANTNYEKLSNLRSTIRKSSVAQLPIRIANVYVIAIQRYLSDPKHQAQTGSSAGQALDVIQLTLADDTHKIKVILHSDLNRLVQRHELQIGSVIIITKCSLHYDETDLSGSSVIVAQELVVTGDQRQLIEQELEDLDWSPDCSKHEKEDVPLTSSRGYFVSLWSSMEMAGPVWNTAEEDLKDLGDTREQDLYSIKDLATKWNSIRSAKPAVLVRVVLKSRMIHYAKPSKSDKWPFQAHMLVADDSGVCTAVFWNEMCPKFYHRIREGSLLLLKKFNVKKGFQIIPRFRPALKDQDYYDIDININSHHPESEVRLIDPDKLSDNVAVVPLWFKMLSRKQAGTVPDNTICDITGVVTYINRFEREPMINKHGFDSGGFWVRRWIHLRDGTSRKPFIVQLYRLAEGMKNLDIKPGVILMLTNVRVQQKLDPHSPSQGQRHVFMTSTAESQVYIIDETSSETIKQQQSVKDVLDWSESAEGRTVVEQSLVGGYFNYPPLASSIAEIKASMKDQMVISSEEWEKVLTSFSYREGRQIMVQAMLVYLKLKNLEANTGAGMARSPRKQSPSKKRKMTDHELILDSDLYESDQGLKSYGKGIMDDDTLPVQYTAGQWDKIKERLDFPATELDFSQTGVVDRQSALISSARSLARHKPKDPSFLPFERGEVVLVYSKSAGSRPDLWAGECNGKKGYFPRSFVREYKVEQPNPTHEVPTELFNFEERTANQAPQQEKPPPSPKEAEPAKSEVEKDETEIDDTEFSDETEVDESDEQEDKPDAQLGEETEPSNQAKEEIQRKEETKKIQQKDKQDGKTIEDTKEVEIDETETAEEDETDVGGDEVDEGKETTDSGASTDSAHQMDATKTGTETDDSVDETELDDDDDDDDDDAEVLDNMDYNEDNDDAIDDGQKKDDETAVKKDENKVDEKQTKQQTVTSQTEEHQASESEMGTQTQKLQDTEAAKNEEPKSENAEGGGSILGSMFNETKEGSVDKTSDTKERSAAGDQLDEKTDIPDKTDIPNSGNVGEPSVDSTESNEEDEDEEEERADSFLDSEKEAADEDKLKKETTSDVNEKLDIVNRTEEEKIPSVTEDSVDLEGSKRNIASSDDMDENTDDKSHRDDVMTDKIKDSDTDKQEEKNADLDEADIDVEEDETMNDNASTDAQKEKQDPGQKDQNQEKPDGEREATASDDESKEDEEDAHVEHIDSTVIQKEKQDPGQMDQNQKKPDAEQEATVSDAKSKEDAHVERIESTALQEEKQDPSQRDQNQKKPDAEQEATVSDDKSKEDAHVERIDSTVSLKEKQDPAQMDQNQKKPDTEQEAAVLDDKSKESEEDTRDAEAVKNTIIHPFGGKTEQEPQKSDDVISESDNNTKEAESDAERKLGESQRDKEREVSSNKIDTDSLKFTNIFEKDDDSLDNKGDSSVEEMKQSAETVQISSDQNKQDSVKEDSKINTGDPKTEVHIDDKPRAAVTETETDSAGKPDDTGKTDVNTEGKKIDDLIDSLDTSKEQDIGQEQKSGEISKEGETKGPSASDAVESETVENKAKSDGYQTYSIQADMTVTPAPTKATTNEQSLQTDSKETEESGIVVDGTVLPADYFGDEDTEKTATVAQYDTQSVEPTPSHTVQESASTQLETTSDAISDIYPSQTTKQASLEVKESTVIKHTEQSSDNTDQTTGTYDLQSSATTDVKTNLNIEPSKTVLEQSASTTEQTDLKSEVVSPQRSLYVDQNTEAKPFVMHDTILKPSTTYSEWNTDDLKKYETPYQPSKKILPLNQGVDVNNRYTPSVIQSSVVESSLQEPVARTDSYSSVESSVEQTMSEASSAIIESDILTQVMDKKENLTVQSDLVQDQVQPSLSQDAYRTADFASRKMLSAEGRQGSLNAEQQQKEQLQGQGHQHQVPIQDQQKERPGHPDIASTQNQGNEQQLADTQSQQLNIQNQGTTQKPDTFEPEVPPTLQPKFDENNNLDENNNYDIDPRLTRTMPNEKIDEEFPTPVTISQRMEPQLKFLVDMLPSSIQSVLEQEPLGLSPVLTVLFSIISTSMLGILTCCFLKGSKKSTKTDPLVIIRSLEEQLFIATKEKENLEDDIQMKIKKMKELEKDLSSQQSTAGTVETDLKSFRTDNITLKGQIAAMQLEIENCKFKIEEKDKKIKAAFEQLSKDKEELEEYSYRTADLDKALQMANHSMADKDTEITNLHSQVQSFTEQIQHLETRKQQLNEEAEVWSEKVKELTEQVEQSSGDTRRLQEEVAFKESELEVLRDCFLQLKAFQEEDEMKEDAEESSGVADKLKAMMDVSRVEASLRAIEEERDIMQNKLKIEEESRKEMEDQIETMKRRLETNQTDKMKAERQCQDAQTKLEVLSKYFKEKEAELTRQLGEQEVLKNQNISKLESSDSITKQLEQENITYRRQIDDLNNEIAKAERDFRSQIAANEKKAHENWLATRAAERELKESKHECAMLRQKLTELERKLLHGPSGLIRPITTRGIPPPGIINGPMPPPPVGMDRPPDRPGSRGSVQGRITPRHREDDFRGSPSGPDRPLPPPDRRLPPGMPPPGMPRPPPPHLDDHRSPPPYGMRPPPHHDRRSPPPFDRYPPPRGPRPPFPPPAHMIPIRGPPPPRLRSPPVDQEDDRQGQSVSPYSRQPPSAVGREITRHQSQV